LLTRLLGQRKANKGLDTFTVPARVQPAGRINLHKISLRGGSVSITYRAVLKEKHQVARWPFPPLLRQDYRGEADAVEIYDGVDAPPTASMCQSGGV
jgi:hypothetical protein